MSKKGNIKKLLAVAACLGSVALLSGCGQETEAPKAEIGLVDANAVVMGHPNMAAAQKEMNDEYAKIQNELMDTQSLPPEQRQTKVDELRKRLSDKEKAVVVPVKDASDKAVTAVMEKHGMTVVFDKKAAVAGGTDITKEVLMQEGLSAQDAQAVMDKASGEDSI